MKLSKKYEYLFEMKKLVILCFNFLILVILNIHFSEKIYVTLTSWKGRIKYINNNLESLLNNSIKPKKVILNLSIEEFPNKNLDLPKEILILLKKYDNFEIFWVKKNNNVFKKLIPTIKRFKKDLIISLDDDILYPNNTFEKMLKCYDKLGRNNPVSFGTIYSDWKINGKVIHSHFGAGSIVKYKFFNNKIDEIYKYTTIDRINKGIKCQDDTLYTYAALLNGYKYLRCKEYTINLKFHKHFLKSSFSENYKRNYLIRLNQYHKKIKYFILKKYNITIKNLIEKI